MHVNPSDLLKEARINLGLTEHEAAAKCGLNFPSYRDLEWYEDELYSVYSTAEWFSMSKTLQFDPCRLVDDSPYLFADSFALVSQRLQDRYRGLTPEEFENFQETVGWDITQVLDCGYALVGYSIDALKDICRETNCNWRGVFVDLYEEWLRREITG